MWQLVSKAYPHLDERAKEIIALEMFWNGHLERGTRTMASMRSLGIVEEVGGFIIQYEIIRPSEQRKVTNQSIVPKRGQKNRLARRVFQHNL